MGIFFSLCVRGRVDEGVVDDTYAGETTILAPLLESKCIMFVAALDYPLRGADCQPHHYYRSTVVRVLNKGTLIQPINFARLSLT